MYLAWKHNILCLIAEDTTLNKKEGVVNEDNVVNKYNMFVAVFAYCFQNNG